MSEVSVTFHFLDGIQQGGVVWADAGMPDGTPVWVALDMEDETDRGWALSLVEPLGRTGGTVTRRQLPRERGGEAPHWSRPRNPPYAGRRPDTFIPHPADEPR